MSKQAGSDCVLTIGANDAVTIRDADIAISQGLVDVTARDSAKWREELSNIKEWTISGTIVYKADDAAMVALRAAALAGTLVDDVLFVFKDLEGFRGSVNVSEFAAAQPLEGEVIVTITLKGKGAVSFLDPVS